jgi:hypothetical protein
LTTLLVVVAAAVLGMTRPGASWGASFDPAGDLPAAAPAALVSLEEQELPGELGSAPGAALGAHRSITCWKPGASWD